MDNIKKFEDFLDRMQGLLDSAKKQGHIIVRVEDLENTFPELKESEDEKIRKYLIERIISAYGENSFTPEGIKVKDIIDWLEKQKRLYSDYEESELRRGLLWHLKELQNIEKSKGLPIKSKATYESWIAWLEKQGEQKPTDKVEPKFKVGDWIVQENIGVYKVIEVCESWYEVIDNKDKHYSIGFDKEYMCHLWTIKDAKDGDVLVHNNCTFIFMGIKDGIVQAIEENILELVSFGEPNKDNDYHPATKEQRDTLLKAMADAGYTFDFEKKELKKL